MEKRICWKKGMRLTDDIMRASEDATAARIGNAMALASAGRFGLLPSPQQFQLSLNISAEAVEIQAVPDEYRKQLCKVVADNVDKIQGSLEDSAQKADRSGKLSAIVRNHRINSF